MNIQIIPDAKIIIRNPDDEPMQRHKNYRGHAQLIDEGTIEMEQTTMVFVPDTSDHSHHNPTIYKGREISCRLQQDGRYLARFYIHPEYDLEIHLKRVLYEAKATYRAVNEDHIIRGGA